MKKAFKFLLWLVLALVTLIVLGVLALVFFVNPNNFKPQIISAFESATGRHMQIPGKLSWTFFPNVGIKAGKIVIDNPTGYTPTTFAEIKHAEVSIAVAPLLSGEIAINKVNVQGLALNLIQHNPTTNNWSFGKAAKPAVTVVKPQHATEQVKQAVHQQPAAHDDTPLNLVIHQIDIQGASVGFTNKLTNKTYQVHDLSLSARNIQLNKPFDLTLSFTANSSDPKLVAKEILQAKLSPNQKQQIFILQQMKLHSDITMQQAHAKPMHIVADLTGNANINLKKQTLSMAPSLTVNNIVTAHGKFDVSQLLSQPHYHGQLTLPQFDMVKLMQSLNKPLPTFPNKQALSQVSLQAHFSGTGQAFDLSKLDATIDQTHLTGALNVQHFAAPAITSNLSIDQLPVSHYVNLNGAELPVSQVAFNANLTMKGLTQKTFPSTLNGDINWSVQSMTLKGIDLHAVINAVGATIRSVLSGKDLQQSLQQLQAQLPQKGQPVDPSNGKQTAFGQFTMRETVHNGVLTAKQFELSGPSLNVDGSGTINLNKQQINMLFDVYKPASANDGNPVLKVPYTITGSLKKPASGIDNQLLNKRLGQLAVDAVKESVSKSIENKAKQFIGDLFHH